MESLKYVVALRDALQDCVLARDASSCDYQGRKVVEDIPTRRQTLLLSLYIHEVEAFNELARTLDKDRDNLVKGSKVCNLFKLPRYSD